MPNDKELQITLVDVNKIIPYWRNPRRNDKTVDWLCQILPVYGFNVPIVLDKQNVIVKGHARLKAAKKLGMAQVPCIYSENDDETNKADRIADNKIQEMSFWDIAKQEIEFGRIGKLKFEKLFHPEEISPLDFQPMQHQSLSFQGTSLDDFGDYTEDAINNAEVPYNPQAYSDYGSSDPSQYGYKEREDSEGPPEPPRGLSETPESYAGREGEGSFGGQPGASGGPAESILPRAPKALKTICPYCGATVYVRI